MKESWYCREYHSGDESQILTLYKEVNRREMSADHWQWKFAQSPFGDSYNMMMFDGSKLIGLNSLIPMDVQVSGTIVKAALSVNTMTHPDYRGQGIFAVLGEEAHQLCRSKGVQFGYGFSNNNSYQIGINKIQWKGFGKMGVMKKKLERGAGRPPKSENIYRIDKFDKRVDSLWDKVKGNFNVVVPRTEEFLNWRFTRHPVIKYPKFVFQRDNKEILGYSILKTYTGGGEIKGHIVDMVCVKEKDIVLALINYACNYFIENKIDNDSCNNYPYQPHKHSSVTSISHHIVP